MVRLSGQILSLAAQGLEGGQPTRGGIDTNLCPQWHCLGCRASSYHGTIPKPTTLFKVKSWLL